MIWIILLSMAAKILDGACLALGVCMTLRLFGVI